MRYRSMSDGNQFSQDVAAFVNLVGEAKYLEHLTRIGSGLNHKSYVTETDDLRFSLELQLLNLELMRIRLENKFSGIPSSFHEAADFVLLVGQTIPHLSEKARTELCGKIIGGLKTRGLRSLQHEFRVAGALSDSGYDVRFADLEGEHGGFDFLASRSGHEFEIEAKWVAPYLGQPILPEDAEKFYLALRENFDAGAECSGIPILNITLQNRLDIRQMAILNLVSACNNTAITRTVSVLDDYAKIEFLGIAPISDVIQLYQTMLIDRLNTRVNIFLSITSPPVAIRLSSRRSSQFPTKLLGILKNAAKSQFTQKRPGVIWVHIGHLSSTSEFDMLAYNGGNKSLLDLVASAFFDSSGTDHIIQLVFSGGEYLQQVHDSAISTFKRVVYNAPACKFGDSYPFPGRKKRNLTTSEHRGQSEKILREIRMTCNINAGPKNFSSALTNSVYDRFLSSPVEALRLVGLAELFQRALRLSEQGNPAGAKEVYDRLLAHIDIPVGSTGMEESAQNGEKTANNATSDGTSGQVSTGGSRALQELVAAAHFNRANMLDKLGKDKEAIFDYQVVISRFGNSELPEIASKIAQSLYNSACILAKTPELVKDAIAAYKDIWKRFNAHPSIYQPLIAAQAYVNLGLLLGMTDDAIDVQNEVISRFGESPDAELREQAGMALVGKGRVLAALGRNREALEAFDAVLPQSCASKSGFEIWAMIYKVNVLASTGMENDIPDICRKLVDYIKQIADLRLKIAVSGVIFATANILKNAGDHVGSISFLDMLIQKFGTEVDAELFSLVVEGRMRKVEELVLLGRNSDAISVCDDIVSCCRSANSSPEYSEAIKWATTTKRLLLGEER